MDGLDQERVACGKTCPKSRLIFSHIDGSNVLILLYFGWSVQI
jgi:hypothetical protein